MVKRNSWRADVSLGAPDSAEPYEVSLAVREKGWVPYQIRFVPKNPHGSLK
jgi:hypothetical protein